jgi:hypothetical protein
MCFIKGEILAIPESVLVLFGTGVGITGAFKVAQKILGENK